MEREEGGRGRVEGWVEKKKHEGLLAVRATLSCFPSLPTYLQVTDAETFNLTPSHVMCVHPYTIKHIRDPQPHWHRHVQGTVHQPQQQELPQIASSGLDKH